MNDLLAPQSLAEFAPDWFTRALSEEFPGIRVSKAEQLDVIRGCSTKIRYAMSYEPGSNQELPTHVIVKGGYEAHSKFKAELYVHEALAYRHIVPEANVITPRCYFSHVDATGAGLVIIEDLTKSGAQFLSLQQPIGYDLAAAFLESLARIHARWWNAPELDDPNVFGGKCLVTMDEGYIVDNMMATVLAPQKFNEFMAMPRGAGTPKVLRDAERLRRGLLRLGASYRSGDITVNHGDTHLGNLYVTSDGAPGFLDWQPFKGPWCHDVSYFMVAALDVPDRRRWEAPLLAHYLDALRRLGVEAPSFDEAWFLYRRDVLWGFFVWLTNGNEFQGESNNTAATVRFATAMVDHDVYSLVER